MTDNFKKLISEKQAELNKLESQLEEVRSRLIDESVTFVRDRYQQTVDTYIKNKADITLSLGKEKLAQMKLKVKRLIEGAEKIVSEMLSDDSIWCPLERALAS